MKRFTILLIAVLMCSCGGGSSPTGPTGQKVADVAGVWTGTVMVTNISGGECVGVTAQALGVIGASQTYTLQIDQTGANLTAIATSTATGNSTNFSGTAGATSFVLNATFSTNAFTYGYLCTNGLRRDTQLTAASINANISGNAGSGTYAESTNVYLPGTQSGVSGGIMTTNAGFSMTR